MPHYSVEILEEELKNRVAKDWFSKFDNVKILGKVDFCICRGEQNLLWAEAKKGVKHDIYESFVQLILTIGRARTYSDNLPPKYLGAFDAEKIAFIEYSSVYEIFYRTDFNWKVTPSDHKTKEFKELMELVREKLYDSKIFYFDDDQKELQEVISKMAEGEDTKIQIDKNNFTHIYQKWRKIVMPMIGINWEMARESNTIAADFYIADVLCDKNMTLKESLHVLWRKDHYELRKGIDNAGFIEWRAATFLDGGEAYKAFWRLYKRPPRKEYWNYIIERRDLLVPADIRERKGSFFTPSIWVQKAQQYIAKTLGENWQDEYYVWDCAAGTGNLLSGLTEGHRLYASTLDPADVKVMEDLSRDRSLTLDKSHIFSFDFLRDSFDTLPEGLKSIINDPEKRKKLIIFINPPYAEASSYGEKGKPNVANKTLVFKRYQEMVGAEALSELFAQFLIRIYQELSGCIIANFSTPKFLNSIKYERFRGIFRVQFLGGFICPAYTFDNVNGLFPIGFFVLRTNHNKEFSRIKMDVFNANGRKLDNKIFHTHRKEKIISNWRKSFYDNSTPVLAQLIVVGATMQSNNNTFITSQAKDSYVKKKMVANITPSNLIQMSIYAAVRHVVTTTWINHNDHYLKPKKLWENDTEFHHDCLAYVLFYEKNNIRSTERTNYLIPFTEKEVGARDAYQSRFLINFLSGEIKQEEKQQIFQGKQSKPEKITFSTQAQAVMDCAKELFIYYHKQQDAQNDASFYDIRLYFQGTDEKGRMNNGSNDETYNDLLKQLREAQKTLAEKIAKKVYEHGFLEQ